MKKTVYAQTTTGVLFPVAVVEGASKAWTAAQLHAKRFPTDTVCVGSIAEEVFMATVSVWKPS